LTKQIVIIFPKHQFILINCLFFFSWPIVVVQSRFLENK
jgi:hypothetical protein